jgi:hypothetical protein
VQQLDRADADSKKDKTLEKFKGCNQLEAARSGCVGPSVVLWLVPRSSHRINSDYTVAQSPGQSTLAHSVAGGEKTGVLAIGRSDKFVVSRTVEAYDAAEPSVQDTIQVR